MTKSLRLPYCFFVFVLSILILLPSLGKAADQRPLMRFPDVHGNTIVFVHGEDIWTVPVLCGSPAGPITQVTSDGADDGDPTWAPGGGVVAFRTNRGGNEDIWLVPVAAGLPSGPAVPLTDDPVDDFGPEWSRWCPGSQIAFCCARLGSRDIWVIAPGPYSVDSESWARVKARYRR